MKTCKTCRRSKSETSFYRKGSSLMGSCKDCMDARATAWRATHPDRVKAWGKATRARHPERRRAEQLRIKFGITISDYDRMLAEQDGRCAICSTLPGKKRLAVDHDHETWKVRGLLCDNCNGGIGLLRDDPILCLIAADYIVGADSIAKKCMASQKAHQEIAK